MNEGRRFAAIVSYIGSEFGGSVKMIAERLGVRPSMVYRYMNTEKLSGVVIDRISRLRNTSWRINVPEYLIDESAPIVAAEIVEGGLEYYKEKVSLLEEQIKALQRVVALQSQLLKDNVQLSDELRQALE